MNGVAIPQHATISRGFLLVKTSKTFDEPFAFDCGKLYTSIAIENENEIYQIASKSILAPSLYGTVKLP